MAKVTVWKHTKSGKLFTEEEDYKHFSHWYNNKRIEEREKRKQVLLEKRRLDVIRKKNREIRKKLVSIIEEQIKSTQIEIKQWEKDLEEHISKATKDVQNQLDDYQNQIQRMNLAIGICRNSLKLHKAEAIKEFKIHNPIFGRRKNLSRMKDDLYKARNISYNLPPNYKKKYLCSGQKGK